MREILFKAKREDNSEWIEGFYYEHQPPLQCFAGENTEKSKHYILQTGFADWGMPRKIDLIEVIPETVCQYTGLQDKNGKRIFEGDIICYKNTMEHGTGIVETMDFLQVRVKWTEQYTVFSTEYSGISVLGCPHEVEVIGNIHDRSGNSEPDN